MVPRGMGLSWCSFVEIAVFGVASVGSCLSGSGKYHGARGVIWLWSRSDYTVPAGQVTSVQRFGSGVLMGLYS